MKKLALSIAAVISSAVPAFAAPVAAPKAPISSSSDSPFKAGDLMVRVRALGVLPDESSNLTPIGGTVDVSDNVVPEVDFSYFFTSNISAELIAAITPHNVKVNSGAANGTDAGRAWLLPPTLTLQYHFTQLCPQAIPYVGAGVNYTHFFAANAGSLGSVKYDDSFGGALQAGVDIPIGHNWYANLDVKKVYITTNAKFSPSGINAHVNIDPWLVGVGVGYKF